MSTPRREKSHRGHFILDQLEKRMSEQEESVMLKRDIPKDKPRPGGHGRAVVVLVAFVAGAAVGSVLQSFRRKRRRIPVPVVDDTEQLQQPSRQRRPHCGALDLPQYPPAQTEFDTQSAQAIAVCSHWAVLYVNRATCYFRLQEWDKVEQQCKQALSKEPAHVQAHYLLGKALKELGRLSEAIEHFRQATEAAYQEDDAVKAQIWYEHNDARYELWRQESEVRKQEQQQLQAHVLHAMKQAHATKAATTTDLPSLDDLKAEHEACLAAVEHIFKTANAGLEAGCVDTTFRCPITEEIFRDPVLAPSGTSFERSAIQLWLVKKNADPLTNDPLRMGQLRPNNNLRSAAHKYLEDTPWVWAS
ncbi:hypothetical protein WJX82_000028 [Trebouxia sp. C0006]